MYEQVLQGNMGQVDWEIFHTPVKMGLTEQI
jgi:hypothetical protein